jgi:hypothetical protein
LDVSLGQVLEGVDFFDGLHEDGVEDVIDAGTSQALDGAIPYEFTVNQISVGACESVDQVEHHRTLISFY